MRDHQHPSRLKVAKFSTVHVGIPEALIEHLLAEGPRGTQEVSSITTSSATGGTQRLQPHVQRLKENVNYLLRAQGDMVEDLLIKTINSFSLEIMAKYLPKRVKLLSLRHYDRTSGAKDHLDKFNSWMCLYGIHEAIMC